MTRIGKQGVMARVGRTRIVMHGRLPKGMSVLDRELAIVLVGLGVWLDIDYDRAGQFSYIQNLETAKEAWEALQVTNEGTKAVKKSRLQLLTSQFEVLQMDEEDMC
ncbi:hypothetical protein LWI29_009126 [Acer saccharum]|uniref:Uncharacterized protein n=1 Tax=Acer saccharum TaxID=4024 RepID=A0AA39SVI6_ACESA|nr:hypothetical protein LWI29_009126 [Acer saccharum]